MSDFDDYKRDDYDRSKDYSLDTEFLELYKSSVEENKKQNVEEKKPQGTVKQETKKEVKETKGNSFFDEGIFTSGNAKPQDSSTANTNGAPKSNGRYGMSDFDAVREEYGKFKDYPTTPLKKYLGIGLVIFIFAVFGLSVLFANREEISLSLIFAGIFVGTILLLIIIQTIREKIALKKPTGNYTVKQGKVLGCAISSRTSVINKVTITYKVMLEVDGKNVETFSREYLKKGLDVTLYVHGKIHYIAKDN